MPRYQFFVRHSFSEGNRAATVLAQGATPHLHHHLMNLVDQLSRSHDDVAFDRTPQIRDVVAKIVDRRPSYRYDSPRDADVVSRHDVNMYRRHNVSFTEQQDALRKCGLGEAWRSALTAPWHVSRLVRTWETALLMRDQLNLSEPLTLVLDTRLDETFGNLTNRLGPLGTIGNLGARMDRVPPENRPSHTLKHALKKLRDFASLEGLTLNNVELLIKNKDGDLQDVLSVDDTQLTSAQFPVWHTLRDVACTAPKWNDASGELFFTHSKCIDAMTNGTIHPKNSMIVVRAMAAPSHFFRAQDC